MKKNKGFTLIEILVVIVIIGIIFTIGVTSSLGSSKRLNEKLYNEKVDLVLTAAKQFGQASTELFTDTCAHLDEPVSDAKCLNISMQNLVDNNYLKPEDIIDPRDKSSMSGTNIEIQYYYDKVYAVVYSGIGSTSGTLVINGGAASTVNRNVTLTLSSTMPNTTEMCISNTTTCTTWIPYNTIQGWTLTQEEGTKTVSVWFRDVSKNQSSVVTDTILFNPTTSTASLSINNGATYTGTRNVSLIISSNTSETGVTSMCISNSTTCTAWESYTTTKSWTLTDLDGLKTVKVWFRDEEGNQFADATDTIIYETVPPTGSISPAGGITYTNNQTLSLTLNATDNLSGVGSMCISLTTTCSAWESYGTSKTISLNNVDGNQTIYAWYRDNVGNVSTRYSTNIHLDRTSPSIGTISINGGADYATDANVTLTLSSTDTTSGVFQMCVSQTPTCTSWVTYGTSYNVTLSAGDGLKRVYVLYRDRAGNQSAQISDTITLDTVVPVCTNGGGSNVWTNANRTITYGCQDNGGTGCDPAFSGGNIVYSTTTQTATAPAYTIKDLAGNTVSCPSRSVDIYVDKTLPACTNSGDSTTWTNANRTITYGCSDANSGCNSSYSGSSTTFSTTIKNSTIAAYEIRDNAGNSVTCTSRIADVYVDKTPPTCTNSGDSTTWTNANRVINFGCSDSDSLCNASYSGGSTTILTTNQTVSIASYNIRDNAGNSVTCIARTANAYVDKTPPTCTVTKTNTGTTTGVTATVVGSDIGSGIASGNVVENNLTSGKTYTVTDRVNLTGTCSVTVTAQTEYRTSGCSAYNTCQNSACGWNSCLTGQITCVGGYNTCQTSACGVQSYNSCSNSACGCQTYNSCRAATCGVESYNTCQHADCGYNDCLSGSNTCVGGNNSCRTSGCGVQAYNSCANSACGYASCNDSACGCASYDGGTVSYPSSCSATGAGGASYTACSVNSYVCNCKCTVPSGSWTTTWWGTQACNQTRCRTVRGCTSGLVATASYTVKTYKRTVYNCTGWNWCATANCGYATCATAGCGVSLYNYCQNSACGWNSCLTGSNTCVGGNNTCATAACGVSQYNSCVNSSCTCAAYNTCRTAACGVESYNSCQNSACGWNACLTGVNTCVGGYNSCATSACGCQTWGTWSAWTTTACTASGSLQCQSRIAYY